MRLRNKKTGEIYTLSDDLYIEYTQGGRIEVRAIIPGGNMSYYYDSLDKLNEDWEDYQPAEPLIKDEKIRKAVRAWAETNSIDKIIIFDYINDSPYVSAGEVKFAEYGGYFDIRFRTDEKFDTGKIYTITELCGEEG